MSGRLLPCCRLRTAAGSGALGWRLASYGAPSAASLPPDMSSQPPAVSPALRPQRGPSPCFTNPPRPQRRAYNEALLLRGGPSPRINRGLGDVDLAACPPLYTGPSLIKPTTRDKLVACIAKVRALGCRGLSVATECKGRR